MGGSCFWIEINSFLSWIGLIKAQCNPSQCQNLGKLGGEYNSNPNFNTPYKGNIDIISHNQAISNCDDTSQTVDINDHEDPNKSMTETTEIVNIGTKDDCSIMIKIGERSHKALWLSNLSVLPK